MKEHVQKPGVRKWAGEDLLELQGETLTALQALVEPYAPCIIQGCGVDQTDGVYQVQPGIVALKGSNEDGNACTKIVRFAGYTGEVLPIYLTIKVTPYMRVYADEENKPIAYEYTAEAFTAEPVDIPYLKIEATGGKRLVDTIGITQKLDREGGNASNVKVVSFKEDTAAGRINIAAGMTMKELFGRIYRWLRDLQPIAFKEKVEKSDFKDELKNEFNNKVDKDGNKVLSTNDFTDAYKDKLDGIDTGANKYVHPITAGNRHIPSGGSTGKYLKYGGLSGTVTWATPTASEIGAAESSHSHDAATQSAAGFMSAADKKKLDGIATGANNYTHPTTAGNNHIPSGGSTGKYLKYGGSSGTATWATPTASEVGALPTTGGTINGSLNVTGQLKENGSRVFSNKYKPSIAYDIADVVIGHVTTNKVVTVFSGPNVVCLSYNTTGWCRLRIENAYYGNAVISVTADNGQSVKSLGRTIYMDDCIEFDIQFNASVDFDFVIFLFGEY